MDIKVNPMGLSPSPGANPGPDEVRALDDTRIDELTRWHGMDESNLPPAATLKNLARDTVAALHELQQARATIVTLRTAMAQAFWATRFDEVHAILLRGLGPPPDDGMN